MHYRVRGVNQAFRAIVSDIHHRRVGVQETESRYGNVIRISEPVIITYTHPRERVLFNANRDQNCYFTLFESLWMLAGRNDLAPLTYFNSRMAEFSDDGGITQPAAYGYRWRQFFGWDQLEGIIEELKASPQSRRVVLHMWDASCYENKHRTHHDFYKATHGSLDVPCNTNAYFDIIDGELNMTVCNRSNDLIWGCTGANAVHFSLLLEYLACCIGVEVGNYNQFSNNLHVYTERWEPELWLKDEATEPQYANDREDQTVNGGLLPGPLLVKDPAVFDKEVEQFIDNWSVTQYMEWKEPFLRNVAQPMCQAFKLHKERNYKAAYYKMDTVIAEDWHTAGVQWLQRREAIYLGKASAL